MTDFSIPALQWQTYSNSQGNMICPVLCDFGTYGKYSINPSGNNSTLSTVRVADGVVIDNVLNSFVVNVSMGAYTETVPAYTKSILKLPEAGPQILITSAGPQILTLYFFTGVFPGSQYATNYLAVQTTAALAVRTGIVEFFAGQPVNIPANSLLADGSAVSRATYSGLFSKIGTIWGPGDGTTTFNLPNVNGRMIVGAGAASGLTNRAVGVTGGVESVGLLAANNGPHSHAVSDPGHAHNYIGGPNPAGTGTVGAAGQSGNAYFMGTQPAFTGISIVSQGSGTPHENMPPFAAMTAIIWT